MKSKKLWILVGLLTVGLAAWASGYRDFTEGMRWGMADGTANATMESTGALSIDSDLTVGLPGTASTRIIEMKAAAAQRESIRYWSGTDLRWNVQKDQDDDFKWTRYTGGSGGTFQDYPLKISNTNGTVSLAHDLIFTERSALASTPAAGFGYLWTKNTTPSTLIFTDDAGTDHTLGSGGGGGGDALTSNPLSQFAATTSSQFAGVISDETGTGAVVLANSPTLVTPALGTPASGVLTNMTGLPIATGLASGTSSDLAGRISDETGSGALVFGTSPTFITPALGTPASGNLANCTFPTLNQSTTGSAASLTTARAIYGNNFDGTAALTQIIASTYGGTGNGFTKFSGPASSEKTFTLPNASDTLAALGTIQTWTAAQSFNSTKFILNGSTSGTTTVNAAATAGTTTLTLPAATDTLVGKATTDTFTNKRVTKREGNTTSSATPTINTDNYDIYRLTAQAADITSFTTNLSGSPNIGDQIRIQVTGTAARAITWGSSFSDGPATKPTTTVTTKTLYTLWEWDGSIWRCMATGSNP